MKKSKNVLFAIYKKKKRNNQVVSTRFRRKNYCKIRNH